MSEKCWICGKDKGQPPKRCNGHYNEFPDDGLWKDVKGILLMLLVSGALVVFLVIAPWLIDQLYILTGAKL